MMTVYLFGYTFLFGALVGGVLSALLLTYLNKPA